MSSELVSFVDSIGFPIVVCLIMFKYMSDQTASHKEEMKNFSEAINNNTNVMQRLLDKLEDKVNG